MWEYRELSKNDLIRLVKNQDQIIFTQDQQIQVQAALIHNQAVAIDKLEELTGKLEKQLVALENKVHSSGKDSSTSSKPPSSDFPKKNRSLRVKNGKKSGGQIGHIGVTRPLIEKPDVVVDCRPDVCKDCGKDLSGLESTVQGKEQVADIPPITPVVTQYNRIEIVCSCGVINTGILPHTASGVMDHME